MPQALLKLLMVGLAWWLGFLALRRLIVAAVTVAVAVLVVSYLADPQEPLQLATAVWRAAERPLRELGVLLWTLARQAASELLGALR